MRTLPKGVLVATAQRPWRGAGGDFHEVAELGGAVWVLVADVCGNGPAAHELARDLRRRVRRELRTAASPAGLLGALNDWFHPRCGADRFATAVVARIDLARRRATVAAAGHLGPFVRSAGALRAPSMAACGTALGMFAAARYLDAELLPEADDLLVFATDGVTDGYATDRDPLGERHTRAHFTSLPANVGAICRALMERTSSDHDATVVALRLHGPEVLEVRGVA